MTDYAEEQANELEALESIYPDELTCKCLQGLYFWNIVPHWAIMKVFGTGFPVGCNRFSVCKLP